MIITGILMGQSCKITKLSNKREKIVVKVTDKHDCKVIRKFQVGSFFVEIRGRFCHL